MIRSGVKIQGIPADDWQDAIFAWDLLKMNRRLLHNLQPAREGTISRQAIIQGSVRIGKGTTIGPNTIISGPVVIGNDCTIGPGCCIMPNTSQQYLATSNVTEITLITDNPDKDDIYRNDLKKQLPENQIATWRELAQGIEGAAKQDEISTYIFVIFISIIAIVGIVNTMMMSVFEKVREIGTLKAMGMTDSDVRGIFVIEGFIIGTAGGIIGMILGGLLVWYFVAVGYDITAMMGKNNENMMASLRLAGTIRAIWDIPSFFYAFFSSIIASMLASYYPAKKTTGMQAAECLRTIQ